MPAASGMVSAPPPAEQPPKAASVFAACTASRREQPAPTLNSSAKVVGVIVAAPAVPGMPRAAMAPIASASLIPFMPVPLPGRLSPGRYPHAAAGSRFDRKYES